MTIEQAKDVIQSSTLPADIKAQALENLEQHWNELPSYLENAIAAAIDQFDWVKTRQGDDYWDSICKRAERGEFDPPAESVEDKPINFDTQYLPTCIITGRRDNLRMHAQRNGKGDMIGWMFVHESIQFENIDIQVNFTTKK